MTSPDLTAANIEKIAELFPGVVTETLDAEGNPTRAIDFDLLRQELSDHVVEDSQERYQLDWPGKRAALFTANTPVAKTLRPVRRDSVDFETTKNLFIEGDNLDALKLLQESYLSKVKLIYIDPPYNTGRDFIYDDDYAEPSDEYFARSGQVDGQGARLVANTEANGRFHSDWLSMMYPRLKLARNLLKDDGVIFISIDDNEVDNLRRICAEVFGAKNFIATIIWENIHTRKNTAQYMSDNHDYIVVFARNKSQFVMHPEVRSEELDSGYTNRDNDPRGPWSDGPVQARNYYSKGTYPIRCPSGRIIDGPPPGNYWRVSEEEFRALDADGRIWWGKDGGNVPRIKRFLSEVKAGIVPQTIWPHDEVGHTQDAKKDLLSYVSFSHAENVLSSLKPVELVRRILRLSTDPTGDDIVLDFFSGSGTTAHAVLKQNAEDGGRRRFIAVQIDEPLPKPEPEFNSILGMSLARVRNVANEINGEADGENLRDVGYRLLTIDTTNMTDVGRTADETNQELFSQLVDSVKPGRTGEDLLFQVLLDWGLELTMPVSVEQIEGHEVFVVDDDVLISCFDTEISLDVVRAIAKREPLRAVFRDSGFASDDDRINAEQIFHEISPSTDVKAI